MSCTAARAGATRRVATPLIAFRPVALLLIAPLLIAWPPIAPAQLAASAPRGTSGTQQTTRLLELDDLHRLADLTEPVFSPDGESLLYTLSTHNLDSDATVSDIWRVSWRGGQPSAVTSTPFYSEWRAQWHPDGRAIAFLSDRGEDETAQIFVQPLEGGEARQLTHVRAGIEDFIWSPDGTRLAFIAADDPPDAGQDSRGEDKPAPPIVTTRFQFKEDGRDYLTARRQHLYLLELASGAVTLLTPGDHDEWLPSWSPDGKWIAFVTKRGADADRNLNFDVYVIAAQPGAVARQVSTFAGTDVDPYWESRPQWSPDSRRLVWLQSGEDKWIYYAPWQLAVADLQTGAITTPARIDRCFYKPRFSPDGRFIYALIEQPQNTWLARIDPSKDTVTYLTQGKRFAYDFDVAANGRLALLGGDDRTPYEISAVESGRAARLRPLTQHNAFLASVTLQPAEDISFRSDGERIDALLMRPAGFRPGVRYPLIVRVHGGPVYQYSHEFQFDWQLYAAQGYLVLGVNPRGSSGRGFDFARAIYADWGNLDVKDVLAGIDHVVEQGWADRERIGVGGWSYGGILTDYLIASDTRFAAAVSGAGSANALAMYGHDQYAREMHLELGAPWKNAELYQRLSYPFLHADRIRTPTMFQCAQNDFNVPCLGAEQMYQALRSLDVPTQLVIYPDQNHGLTVPSYLRDRLARNLEWYARYLQPPAPTEPAQRD